MRTLKLYCYVDETGQDTKGDFFLVAVLLKEKSDLLKLEGQLVFIEKKTGKKSLKWKKTNNRIKSKYLKELIKINELKNSIFYSQYHLSKEYSKLTSLTIAKAVLMKENRDYSVTIIIDGLNDKERAVVRDELKKLKINYRKIRGMKDGQSVFLRLSDSMAGLLRDMIEGKKYAQNIMKKLITTKIVTET